MPGSALRGVQVHGDLDHRMVISACYMADTDGDPPEWIAELRRQRAARRHASGSEARGAPINPAFALPRTTLDRDQRLRQVLDTIDLVHGDGVLPIVRVEWRALRDQRAAEFVAFEPDSGRADRLRLDPTRRRWPIAMVHEVGHLLDIRGIGRPPDLASVADERMAPWRRAVEASKAVAALVVVGVRLDPYYLRPEELWARSYAQWLATRGDDGWLLQQIRELRGANPGRATYYTQWDADDFAPIAAAIDLLFRSLEWIA
ncbi:MAG TPA: hypothetical protein VMP03_02580 [Methylomirabilota bacterium]|nr:hypothetical protein [Methylomirabilota bacterium]